MNCPDPLELDALARGQVPDARRSLLIEHLDGCRACAELVAELARMASASGGSGSIAFGETSPARTLPSSPPRAGADDANAVVGRYRLVRRLGSGAMGTVFEAFDPDLDRRVAIKILHPDRYGQLEVVRALLVREAQAMARLNHPNVVAVYDVGTTGHQLFLAMELVPGTTLDEYVQRDRARADILAAFVQAGRGLAAAHAAGLVHRDFKPANVLVGDDRRVRVSDFGLARNPIAPAPSAGGMMHTQAGALVGTPAYMSPEQWLGQPADARSDQFSFGAAMFEALTGRSAFTAQTIDALRHAVLSGQREPIPMDLPRHVRAVLDRTLRYRPQDRYPSMEAALRDLDRSSASIVRRVLPWVVLTIGGGALASALVIAWKDATTSPASMPAQCAEAATKLDDVWNDDRRAELSKSLTRGDKVVEQIDRYASDWRSMRVEICESAIREDESEELRDRRNVCLDRRLGSLEAAIGAIGKGAADPMSVVHALPPVADCADRERVMSGIFLPGDPEVRKQVEATHAELEEAVALINASRLAEAEPIIDRALAAAAALGWDPLLAEAQYRRASLLNRRHDARGAERAFKEAFATARSARHDEVTRGAAIELISIVGVDLGRPADAQEWIRYARAEVKRDPTNKTARATLLENEAAIDLVEDRPTDACTKLEEVVVLREEVVGPDDPDVGTARSNLATAMIKAGDLDAALEQRKLAFAIMEKAYGARQPKTADYRVELARAHHELGDLPKALEGYGEALAIYTEWPGTDHRASVAHDLIAKALRTQGDPAAALPHAQKAVALREKELGPEHPSMGDVLGELAETLEEVGRPAEGLPLLDRAEKILTSFYGPDSLDLADCHGLRGGLYKALKRWDDAIAEHTKAIEIVERTAGTAHRDIGRHAYNRALAKKKKGAHLDAFADYLKSIDISEASYPLEHRFVYSSNLAAAWLLMDDLVLPDEAITYFERALASAEKRGGPDSTDTRNTRLALDEAKRRAKK